jgi:2-aminoadipate transaminase
VLHVGTLSKTLCPGFRVGWLIAPKALRERALALKRMQDLQAGSVAQAVVAELFASFDYDAHLRRARALYRSRADALVSALRRALPSFAFREPEGGFSVFAETSERRDDTLLLARAAAHGTSFDPGRLFRASPRRELSLRLCYSALPGRALEEAVRRLARAWRGAARLWPAASSQSERK